MRGCSIAYGGQEAHEPNASWYDGHAVLNVAKYHFTKKGNGLHSKQVIMNVTTKGSLMKCN